MELANLMENNLYEFDVALSFAGEDRLYVDAVAKALRENDVKVFYDKFEEVSSWGKNLYNYLRDVYRDKSKFTVMFISEHYARKLWCRHERESAQDRAFANSSEYILPVRFDDSKIPGLLESIGYIQLSNTTPEELALLICRKLSIDHIYIKQELRISKEPLNKSFPQSSKSSKILDTRLRGYDDNGLDQRFPNSTPAPNDNSKAASPSHVSRTEMELLPKGFDIKICKRCSGKGCWSCDNIGEIIAKKGNECPVCRNSDAYNESRICTYCLSTGFFNFMYRDQS